MLGQHCSEAWDYLPKGTEWCGLPSLGILLLEAILPSPFTGVYTIIIAVILAVML